MIGKTCSGRTVQRALSSARRRSWFSKYQAYVLKMWIEVDIVVMVVAAVVSTQVLSHATELAGHAPSYDKLASKHSSKICTALLKEPRFISRKNCIK